MAVTPEPVHQAACSACGCPDFKLEGFVSDTSAGSGTVTLDGSGMIISYSGLFECVACLTRLELPQLQSQPALTLLKEA